MEANIPEGLNIAYTIVSKYEDHLPLYRKKKIGQRMGVDMPRNTVCGWIMAAAERCMPMREALLRELLCSDYLQANETPLQVMDDPDRKNTSKSYMWVYRSQIPDKKVIVFDYQETRQAEWPKQRLNNFKGYLQTDGYKGYDWVDDSPHITHLGCMAHASALFYSLIATATANYLNPYDYLKHLFENIPRCNTEEDFQDLLPFNIKPL